MFHAVCSFLTPIFFDLSADTQPPDVTNNTNQIRRAAPADRLGRYGVIGQTMGGNGVAMTGGPGQLNQSTSLDDPTGTLTSTGGRWKVSAKIQQLLNTLKRPKRRPLPEFYEDDDIELELAANPKDPNAPKPEGGPMTPALGDQLIIPSGLPRSLEAAVQRYGSASYKAPAATVLDPNGKMFTTLTYGKREPTEPTFGHKLFDARLADASNGRKTEKGGARQCRAATRPLSCLLTLPDACLLLPASLNLAK